MIQLDKCDAMCLRSCAVTVKFPSMEGFLYICRYFEITPEEFFASDNQNPEMLRKMVEDIKTLTPGQIDSLNKTISEFKIANKFKKP